MAEEEGKVESQEIPGVTGKFGLGVQNEAGQKLTVPNPYLVKICLVKAMVFPVVMYRCENWTIKKAECQRTDVFKLWCCRRLLRIP